MTMIDSHAHLYFSDYDDDLHDVIMRANSEGVSKIITIGVDLETSEKSIKLADEYESVYAAAGIHPNDANSISADYTDQLIRFFDHPKVVALGEIGLDYYREHTPKHQQLKIFYEQLDFAIDLRLPIIIHNRNAWPDMLDALENSRYKSNLTGVMHCFSGDASIARRILNLGFYISFTGVVTFKNSKAADVIKTIPIDRLLLETDCPFMAPEPHRGKRCEPAYVKLICTKIADVMNLSFDEVAEMTTKNTAALFGI